MNSLFSEKGKFSIAEIASNSLSICIDPVLIIISKLISGGNQSFVQFLGGSEEIITNDIKKIFQLLDIRVGFFKQFIKSQVASSHLPYYNSFFAYILCRFISDFNQVQDNYSIEERMRFIQRGEEIIVEEMKKLKIIIPNQISINNLHSYVNYEPVIGEVYSKYLQHYLELYSQQLFRIQFANIKSSYTDYEYHYDSYILEVEKSRNMHNLYEDIHFLYDHALQKYQGVELILCDFYVNEYMIGEYVKQQQSTLILSTQIISEQHIDSITANNYKNKNKYTILFLSNVPLKYLRELSFAFSIKLFQSPESLSQINQQENAQKFNIMFLDKQTMEYNRSSSELFHLKERSTLLISPDFKLTHVKILQVVITIPSSLQYKQQIITQEIDKQFMKLSRILSHNKCVKGRGYFEEQLGCNIINSNKDNSFLVMVNLVLMRFSQLVNAYSHEFKGEFYDDYKTKKDAILKAIGILKTQQLTPIQITFEIKKKEKEKEDDK